MKNIFKQAEKKIKETQGKYNTTRSRKLKETNVSTIQ